MHSLSMASAIIHTLKSMQILCYGKKRQLTIQSCPTSCLAHLIWEDVSVPVFVNILRFLSSSDVCTLEDGGR